MNIKHIVGVFLLLTNIAATSVHAQKISDLETDTEAAPAASAGSGAASAPDVTKVGDWSVVCGPEGPGSCAMTQLGEDPQGSPAIEFVVRKLDGEDAVIDGVEIAAVADIITPLGVLLEFGLRLKIDGGEERGAPYRICQQHGCLVREPLSEAVITSLKRGANATVTVAAEGAGPVQINISLRGFTKAFDSL